MKRVICCLDGTWNNNLAGSILTNVGKLHQVILPIDGKGVEQVTHYIEGIGTAQGERFQFVKGGVGAGVEDRVRKAYEALVEDYQPGDEIYLIGFSRGAFAARSLGGFITLFGIAQAGGSFSYDQAWGLYRVPEKKRSQGSVADLRSASHYPVRIKCVGVWDTVGNLGNPLLPGGLVARRSAFHDTRLSENIDVALHALAIDEPRGPYRPTLWTQATGQALPAHQHVEQVWFAGTHADVGGGHRETGLSDVALLWMAQRLQAKTGLALDMHQLEHLTRPDALGPQHAVTTGWLFGWSGWFPFIRLVKQAAEAIPPLRRSLIGGWRSSKLPSGIEPVNESIHESVLERFGKRVIELRDGRSSAIAYRPSNLVPALPQPMPERPAEPAKPAAGTMRRVKIFTVHGTFDHDADWDNWDRADDPKKGQRAFTNRLATLLKERGIALDEVDHTQDNWSGGNSHDERRVAAIGLKKLIQEELSKAYERHGRDYYDKVFIVGHSHGGTISRLAMNLWDKDDEYYDPVKTPQRDEFKLDDRCPTCLRARNGMVGRNSVRRPDGVITFGSPFVTFEKRRLGLVTARLSAWVFRILAAIPLTFILYLAYGDFGPAAVVSVMWSWTLDFLKTALLLTWPLALYWMFASHLPRLFAPIDRRLGRSTAPLTLSAALRGVKYLLLAALVAYYFAYLSGQLDRILQWPALSNPSFLDGLAWLHLLTVVLFVIVAVPGSFLMWLNREVVGLREKLPTKYDPAEDRLTKYVSYHTPGDEAGVHLRVFGTLTWVVQTLALSAACVLAFGIALTVLIGIESVLSLSQGGGLLDRLGISAASDFPEFRDRFIALMDGLTYLPRLVWSDMLGASWLTSLGELETGRAVAWFVPVAILVAILLILVLLMPLVVLAVALVYLVSMRLRGTGVVFGSEKLSWNLANLITVTRHANQNTALRLFFIAPEAWWHREIAHCYYYKSGRVIEDVANQIAEWSSHKPTPALPVEAWFAAVGRALVVLLFVLSIFAVSVPIAPSLASLAETKIDLAGEKVGLLSAILDQGGWEWIDDSRQSPGSWPEPKNADEYARRGVAFETRGHLVHALADYTKAIALEPSNAGRYNERGRFFGLKGDYDEAIADFTKAIALEPGNARRYNERGRLVGSKGHYDQAIADFTKAAELDPQNAWALIYRGLTYRQKGDDDRALADFSQAVGLAPDNAAAFGGRGSTYFVRGEFDAAIADFAKAVELQPDSPMHVRSLGIAKYGKGAFKDAAADLGRSMKMRASVDAMLFRYLARTRAGESGEAELEANASQLKIERWPHAVVELYLGKRSSAATLDAAKGENERCSVQFHIGQWHILKGNAVEAAAVHKIAVDTCPKNSYEYGVAVAELKRLTR